MESRLGRKMGEVGLEKVITVIQFCKQVQVVVPLGKAFGNLLLEFRTELLDNVYTRRSEISWYTLSRDS